jgi:FkbM family methyltransferase
VKFNWNQADPVLFQCRNEVRAEVPRRMLNTFKEVFFKDAYGRYFRQLNEQPTVIDIGANVGYFSLYMFCRFPAAKVIAFEPMPVNHPLLEKHQQMNPGRDFIIDKRAVFGEQTTLNLAYDANDSFTTDASVFGSKGANTTVSVPTLTLPDIFTHYAIQQCDLLKLDCEGAEYSILYNCPDHIFARIRYVALEVHPGREANQNIDALSDFMRAKKFQVKSSAKELLWCWKDS